MLEGNTTSIYDIAQLTWGVTAGLVAVIVILTGVYWKLIILARDILKALEAVTELLKEMHADNAAEHKEFLDMVTRIDERSKKT